MFHFIKVICLSKLMGKKREGRQDFKESNNFLFPIAVKMWLILPFVTVMQGFKMITLSTSPSSALLPPQKRNNKAFEHFRRYAEPRRKLKLHFAIWTSLGRILGPNQAAAGLQPNTHQWLAFLTNKHSNLTSCAKATRQLKWTHTIQPWMKPPSSLLPVKMS